MGDRRRHDLLPIEGDAMHSIRSCLSVDSGPIDEQSRDRMMRASVDCWHNGRVFDVAL